MDMRWLIPIIASISSILFDCNERHHYFKHIAAAMSDAIFSAKALVVAPADEVIVYEKVIL